MQKLSNYEIDEALDCLHQVLNTMKDYLHIDNVIKNETKIIQKKIDSLYNELKKRNEKN